MKNKIRVGILGSCVSREVFTTYYNDYKKDFELIFSHERESFISLFQNQINFDEKDIQILPPSKKNQFRFKNIFNDFSKSFFVDLNKGIDYLIIDVYFEALFGVLVLEDGSIITNNKWDLPKTNFYKKINVINKCDMYDNPNEYFELWVSYCDKLFKFLKESYPHVKIILNKIKLADEVFKDDYSKYINMDFRWMVQTYTPFIKKFENYIEENYDVISIQYDDFVYTSENNRWSPYIVHFTCEYYKYIFYSICKIVGVDELHLLNSKLSFIKAKLYIYGEIMNNSENSIKNMENEINTLKSMLDEKNQIIESNNLELESLNDFKKKVLSSHSWKIIKSLRNLGNIKKKF